MIPSLDSNIDIETWNQQKNGYADEWKEAPGHDSLPRVISDIVDFFLNNLTVNEQHEVVWYFSRELGAVINRHQLKINLLKNKEICVLTACI